jgi:hypothetical protein
MQWLKDIYLSFRWRHFRCPYPIDGHTSVRSCIAAGLCGCDNNKGRSR